MSSLNSCSQLGGTETALNVQSMAALTGAIMALVHHPDVQSRGQAEIDRVVGRDRLPDFSDREQLPYISAICREVLRWRLIAPLAVSHATSKDDVYNGYFIPKGKFTKSFIRNLVYPIHRVYLPVQVLQLLETLGEITPLLPPYILILPCFWIGPSCTTPRSILIQKGSFPSDSSLLKENSQKTKS